jgi:hypothetical protein
MKPDSGRRDQVLFAEYLTESVVLLVQLSEIN